MNNPNRKRVRLQDYDYNSSGYYFITICSKEKNNIFGEIISDEIILSEVGKIINCCWVEIPHHFSFVKLDEYVIMPNHIHGIIILNDKNVKNERNRHACSLQKNRQYQKLPAVIGSFKSSVTRLVNKVNVRNFFAWQKSFYDHIIRNDKSLKNIRDYIINNPKTWGKDIENMKYLDSYNKKDGSSIIPSYYNRLFEQERISIETDMKG